MFLDFYKLREQPFGVTPDPRFLYLGSTHREALASLFYGVEAERGFLTLIAQPGLGKTTLIFQLLEKLQRTARTLFLFQTQCNSREFFQYLLIGLGVDASGMDIVSMHNKLNEILFREMLAGRRFVLAIDEAQNLDAEVLESIRLLSNFETSSAKLLQIVLVGQPQLADKLASPNLLQLQQRIAMSVRLQPFNAEETARYIHHRLEVAGYSGGPIFSSGALQMIAERAQGIPRNINNLCFNALSLGCAMGRQQIDAAIIQEVIGDFQGASPKPLHQTNQSVTPEVFHTTGMNAAPVLSYQAKSNSRPRRWSRAAAAVAVSMALWTLFFSHSPGGIGRLEQANIRAFDFVCTSAESVESFVVTSLVTRGGTGLRNFWQSYDRLIEHVRRPKPPVTNSDGSEPGREILPPQVSIPGGSLTTDGTNPSDKD